MNDRRGWFAPRIQRADYDTLFAGWRLRAWNDLHYDADFETGAVQITEREMVDAWGASKGSVGRWLADLANAGYVRLEKVGERARDARRVVIREIEARGKEWGKSGAVNGAANGVGKHSNGAGSTVGSGAANGAADGASMGQGLGHVVKNSINKERNLPTVPTEPPLFSPAEVAEVQQPATERPVLVLVQQDDSSGNVTADGERMSASDLVGEWLKLQASRPSAREIGKQGAAAKRLCEEHTRPQIAAAVWGLTHRFPWAPPQNESWDLFDLEKQFTKSVQYTATNHPRLKQQRQSSSLRDALRARGHG